MECRFCKSDINTLLESKDFGIGCHECLADIEKNYPCADTYSGVEIRERKSMTFEDILSSDKNEGLREHKKDEAPAYVREYCQSSTDTKKEKNNIEPSHYTDLKISPLEYINANEPEFTWCISNVIKYVSRYKRKNGIEDLKKAEWYLKEQIRILEEK